MRTIKSAYLAIIAILLAPMAANADFMGSTIEVNFLYPDISTNCCGSFDVLVGAGQELAPGDVPGYNSAAFVDISSTQIEYGQTRGTVYSSGSFNGLHFFDELSLLADIVGVSVNAATSLVGFDSSRVSFDANNIYINMVNLSASVAHSVIVDVQFANIPEPGTLALLGLGLAGVGFARRRKQV